MRSSDTGLAHGTSGSPQATIYQHAYAAKLRELEGSLAEANDKASDSLLDPSLINELENGGVKFSRGKMKFVARDGTGQIVWLEQGNAVAGLQHILSRHAKDFETKMLVQRGAREAGQAEDA